MYDASCVCVCPVDMGPSAVEAPDPVEEERERFSLSSSPDAVD